MTTTTAGPGAPGRRAHQVPHAVSPGLWALGWKRLKSDHVGMVSLAIVAAFMVMMVLSGLGLVAGDWSKEVGVNYAPPSWVGADPAEDVAGSPAVPRSAAAASNAGAKAGEEDDSLDPLADVMAAIRKDAAADGASATGTTARAAGSSSNFRL